MSSKKTPSASTKNHLAVLILLFVAFISGYQFRLSQELTKGLCFHATDDQHQPGVPMPVRAIHIAVSETKKQEQNKKRRGIVIHTPYNGSLQRVFPIYPHELPCLNATYGEYRYLFDGRYALTRGMFYTKLSKCSSSTLAGIAVQIARNTAARHRQQKQQVAIAAGEGEGGTAVVSSNVPEECKVRADHGNYYHTMDRDKAHSMLWTFIREPASREVSDFFHFHVSRRGVDPTNDTILMTAAMEALSIANYMTGGKIKNVAGGPEEKVDFIMKTYDFIGLVERYHESLIVLKIIYNLELRDILYAKAKQSGGYDDGEYRNKCSFIQPSVVSPAMKRWFQNSPEWQQYAENDILLYRVVDKSLDLTIDALGRAEVERQVEQLEDALKLADSICGPTAIYPCSVDGKKRLENETTCVAHDWACAHKCIETLDLRQFESR